MTEIEEIFRDTIIFNLSLQLKFFLLKEKELIAAKIKFLSQYND